VKDNGSEGGACADVLSWGPKFPNYCLLPLSQCKVTKVI